MKEKNNNHAKKNWDKSYRNHRKV